MDRGINISAVGLVFNLAFSVYHLVLGITSGSWWLLTVGVYYLLLSFARFFVLRIKTSPGVITKLTGVMLMILSLPLFGTVVLSVVRDRGIVFHEIVMIAIALYAFTKITLAAIKLIKLRGRKSARDRALNTVSFAAALVSIFTLQRSMLVSFEGMTEIEIVIMNLVTGYAVCIAVFWLGLNLFRSKK